VTEPTSAAAKPTSGSAVARSRDPQLSQTSRHAALPTARTTHVHERAAETRADAGTEPTTTQRKLQSTLLILLRLELLVLLGVGSLLLLLSLL
jgi:hypothetical protein